MSASFNALSLRCMSASEGSAERPKAASVCSQGQPYGRPARGDIEAQSTAYPCLAPRLACEADDPGIPPKACARRPPRPDRVTPAGSIGPWTGHATRLRSAGFLRAPLPSPRGGTVPVTHPSWERDERSLREARDAGIRSCLRHGRRLNAGEPQSQLRFKAARSKSHQVPSKGRSTRNRRFNMKRHQESDHDQENSDHPCRLSLGARGSVRLALSAATKTTQIMRIQREEHQARGHVALPKAPPIAADHAP